VDAELGSVPRRHRYRGVNAFFHLNALGFDPDKTILIHGAGTTIGFAAVQIALLRGMQVIATAGETYAQRLRALGAKVTAYGDGMVERVTEVNGGPGRPCPEYRTGRRVSARSCPDRRG
jgi:NADPH:quinone reductase-like Zn-dependent oxidoreductase